MKFLRLTQNAARSNAITGSNGIASRTITSPHRYLDLVQTWYEEAFPAEERREFDDLLALLPCPAMHLCVLMHQQEPVGFIIFWQWPDNGIIFIEHFAIDPARRGQQLGQQALEQVLTLPADYVILETELPTDSIHQRRINFYERQGFITSPFPYAQPPYRPENAPIPMKLLSLPTIETQADFDRFTGLIKERVYGVQV